MTVPMEWRAVDVEGLSRWRSEMDLAVQDAELLIAAGEVGVVVVWRIATTPLRAAAATREAHARAARTPPEPARPIPVLVGGGDESRRPREA